MGMLLGTLICFNGKETPYACASSTKSADRFLLRLGILAVGTKDQTKNSLKCNMLSSCISVSCIPE